MVYTKCGEFCVNFEMFYEVSGLQINFHKSKFFGVGVSANVVLSFASLSGCEVVFFPFKYLDVPVDLNMFLIKNWQPILTSFV